MRTYQGARTEFGCEVTVDGTRLRLRADLTGSDTTTFDWGQTGGRQLALALLADFLADDEQAVRHCEVFDREVVARLPHDSWSMTESALAAALASVNGRRPHPSGDGNNGRPIVQRAPVTNNNIRPDVKPIRAEKPPGKAAVAPPPAPVDHQSVASLAYEFWEKNGRVDGRALNDWLEAEDRLRAKR